MVFMALWALERRVECMDGVVTPEIVTTTRSHAVLKRQTISGREDLCQNGRGQRNLFSPPKKRTKGRQSLTFWNLTGKTVIRMMWNIVKFEFLSTKQMAKTSYLATQCFVLIIPVRKWLSTKALMASLCVMFLRDEFTATRLSFQRIADWSYKKLIILHSFNLLQFCSMNRRLPPKGKVIKESKT